MPQDRYTTTLTPAEEAQFQAWAKRNKIRMEPGWNEDYDMRGLWKSNPNAGPDGRGHFPDTFKLPHHPTFSAESVYATADAPRWSGDKLIDKDGKVVADESPMPWLAALPGPARPQLPAGLGPEKQRTNPLPYIDIFSVLPKGLRLSDIGKRRSK
jgi:hypothetical protein